ncbi:MAG: ABC transporter ATP-binding protein [Ignavibacteria bacterium]
MIIVNDLVKTYPGNCKALDGISFKIEPGEVCGYLGANGAGKSTTVKILTGILNSDAGSVLINDIDVFKRPKDVKQIVGYVPESGALFESLTPFDFLEFVCSIYGIDKKIYVKRIYDFAELFDLSKEIKAPMSSFSRGMKQKVLIISSLIHNPEIIFWDEPLGGLDYNTNVLIRDLITDLSAGGKTFFYCSHILDIVEKVCTKVIILKSGKVVYDDNIRSGSPSLEEIFKKYIDASDKRDKAAEIYRNINS